MLFTAFKVLFSACVVAFVSWLSGKRPELAGFLVALPLLTLLVLPLSYIEYQNPDNAVRFAHSIMTAIPISLMFFVPFLFAHKIPGGFWTLYLSGIACLTAGYFLHRWLMDLFYSN